MQTRKQRLIGWLVQVSGSVISTGFLWILYVLPALVLDSGRNGMMIWITVSAALKRVQHKLPLTSGQLSIKGSWLSLTRRVRRGDNFLRRPRVCCRPSSERQGKSSYTNAGALCVYPRAILCRHSSSINTLPSFLPLFKLHCHVWCLCLPEIHVCLSTMWSAPLVAYQ